MECLKKHDNIKKAYTGFASIGNITPSIMKLKCHNKNKIINKRQLECVLQCVNYLKQHVNYPGLFIVYGSKLHVLRIVGKMQVGDESLYAYLEFHCTPRECASALNLFLLKIGHPLLPKRIQNLLTADNIGVCRQTIALDALGLIRQDIKGTHLDLLSALFDLMKKLSTIGSLRPTELRVSHAPYILLPLLFEANKDISSYWRNVADSLNEMIMYGDLLSEQNFSQLNNQQRLINIETRNPLTGNGNSKDNMSNINGITSATSSSDHTTIIMDNNNGGGIQNTMMQQNQQNFNGMNSVISTQPSVQDTNQNGLMMMMNNQQEQQLQQQTNNNSMSSMTMNQNASIF